ncbi:hypothetical protein EB796_003741 [Bugula neritina]|uniref:Uncharacterized protein n=1 Tax=Bugula neritina TaxID=10212 RepID=A0A7J7KH89_BUGNE|nr:hypothetical protein EB796_003741 [Bugula neritina]
MRWCVLVLLKINMFILALLFSLAQVAFAWHDLTNEEYHCWPFGASDSQPAAFSTCHGVELDWAISPPAEIKESHPFSVSFTLHLQPEFYAWAVQDAQDDFKTNFFKWKNGSFITT